MTIPGRGDLAPARRQHRRRRWPRVLALLLVLGVLGAAGWEAYRLWVEDTSQSRVAAPCVTPTPPPVPAAADEVRVRVLNGTRRPGLAHDVATRLRHRGFAVRKVGNNPQRTARTTVTYPAGVLAAGLAVAEQLPAAELTAGSGRLVDLVLGRDFHRLATRKEAAARRAQDERAASPSPPACAAS